MTLVAGIDSSTQSCKVVIRDAHSGTLVRCGMAPHPIGTEVDPQHWWAALLTAVDAAGGLDDVAAVSIAAQQHGFIALDATGEVIRPALLWNDTRSAGAARDLVNDFGDGDPQHGARRWATEIGSVPTTSFTVAKLRWVADAEPEVLQRLAAVALPHDWLTWKLRGECSPSTLTTDRSDASGTGYFDSVTERYRRDLINLACRSDLGNRLQLPEVTAPHVATGRGSAELGLDHLVVGSGMGDNAAAIFALDLRVGETLVSLGTSGVVCARAATRSADVSGLIAGFADATGHHLPLAATLNGARVIDSATALLGVDHDEFSRLALSAEPGAAGLVLVPFFEGERTPNLPDSTALFDGVTLTSLTRENLARATVEGLLCHLATAREALAAQDMTGPVTLIGGGSRSTAVAALAPALFQTPVRVAASSEYVADGAARQAAWALLGSEDPPPWPVAAGDLITDEPRPDIVNRYRSVVASRYEVPRLATLVAR